MTNIDKMLEGKILKYGTQLYRYNPDKDYFEWKYAQNSNVWDQSSNTLKTINKLNMQEIEPEHLTYEELIEVAKDRYEDLVFELQSHEYKFDEFNERGMWYITSEDNLSELANLATYVQLGLAKVRFK